MNDFEMNLQKLKKLQICRFFIKVLGESDQKLSSYFN